jgi:hypothetical protein
VRTVKSKFRAKAQREEESTPRASVIQSFAGFRLVFVPLRETFASSKMPFHLASAKEQYD